MKGRKLMCVEKLMKNTTDGSDGLVGEFSSTVGQV